MEFEHIRDKNLEIQQPYGGPKIRKYEVLIEIQEGLRIGILADPTELGFELWELNALAELIGRRVGRVLRLSEGRKADIEEVIAKYQPREDQPA